MQGASAKQMAASWAVLEQDVNLHAQAPTSCRQGLLQYSDISPVRQGSHELRGPVGAEVDYARRKQNAVQAYYEWIPIRPVNGADYPANLNINRTFPIGTFRMLCYCQACTLCAGRLVLTHAWPSCVAASRDYQQPSASSAGRLWPR